jgi:hypothetical protein
MTRIATYAIGVIGVTAIVFACLVGVERMLGVIAYAP